MRFEVVWLQEVVTLAKAVAHSTDKKKFTFIFQLSGWALVTPSCFED